jgi:hypothetical protein
MVLEMERWKVGAKEDVGFNDSWAMPSLSIDEPYRGSKPRQVHVTQAERAQKAHEGERWQ